ncbi:MAG: ABC transporter permease [Gemmatimonadales bacterium]
MAGIFLRLLLALHPRSFRSEYGDDIRALFLERWQDGRGPGGLRLRAHLIFDLLRSAAREWRDALGGSRRPGRTSLIGTDVRHLARWLARTPGFALSALATLALGVGATTAIFALVYGVLLRPLAYPEPDRLALIAREGMVSLPDVEDWRARGNAFATIGLYMPGWSLDLTGLGDPRPVATIAAEAQYLEVLGLEPIRGRFFLEEEDRPGGERVIVLTERFWRTELGADPGAIGRVLTLSGHPTTVIGVVADAVDFNEVDAIGVVPLTVELPWTEGQRGTNNLDAIGRVAPGVPFADAAAELTEITRQLVEEYPRTNRGKIVEPAPLTEVLVGPVRPALRVALGAVVTLLLIAAVNLAGLLLARVTARRRELAVRSALGAGRGRIARQLLIEGLALGMVGGGLGLLLANLLLTAARGMLPPSVPRLETLSLSGPVLLFGLGAAVMAGFLCGVVPALRELRSDPLAGLDAGRGTGGRARHRALRSILATEIALAMALLATSGILIKSFERLWSVPLGFEPAGTLSARLVLPESRYGNDREAQTRAYGSIVDRLRETPGVTEAAFALSVPLVPGGAVGNVMLIAGRDVEANRWPGVRVRPVHGDYFSALKLPLVRGRVFDETDRESTQPVAAINRTLARDWWPDSDPIGARVALRDWHEFSDGPVWMTIVGVVDDVKALSLAEGDEPALYQPYAQRQVTWQRFGNLVIRTAGDPVGFERALKEAVWSVDPLLAVSQIRTLTDRRAASAGRERFLALTTALFAGSALLLVAQGLWGLVAYSVAERRREIGVRVALGAQATRVIGLVTRDLLLPTLVGAAAGLGIAIISGKWLESAIFEVSPTDPAVLAITVLVLISVVALASAIPARGATRVDPLEAIRE